MIPLKHNYEMKLSGPCSMTGVSLIILEQYMILLQTVRVRKWNIKTYWLITSTAR